MTARPRVFVTDGSYPNGLAAVRALGEAGYEVTVAEREGVGAAETIAFWSRHCAHRFRYPDPRRDAAAAANALAHHFHAKRYDAAIPVSLEMTKLFVEHPVLQSTPSMLPARESFEIAADKRRTFEHARAAGIAVPLTVAAARWQELQPPIVLKHFATGAAILRSAAEISRAISALGERIGEYVVQEYIPGENGFGYFGFFEQGDEAGYFMHERLMQIPREGGPSVVAHAIRDPALHQLGRSLLESLHWHGVAMVEFKRSSRDGKYYLMEINPKLWGSLDLAIQSGANFPVWIAQSVTGRHQARVWGHYATGLTYQWVIPNGLKCFIRYPEFRPTFVRNLLAKNVRTDFSWRDPLPSAAGLFTMAAHAVKR